MHLRSEQRDQRVIACDDAELEALGAAELHASAAQGEMGNLFDQLDVLPRCAKRSMSFRTNSGKS